MFFVSLPSEITFDNGNKIFHYYDATGQRYRTESVTYQWTGVTRPAGTGNSGTSQSTLTTINNITHINDNVVYKQLNSGPITLSRANNPEGYVAPTIREREDGIDASLRHGMSFCYYIKDHLGNIREVYSSCKVTHVDFATLDDDGNPIVINQYNTPLTCTQRTQYYPSGLPWRDCYHADEQPFKYNSKEFVEMHGLDEYDSQARWYYPAIMRTTTMDPLCEKYYDISPYAWCGNNPVNYVDPDGRDVYNFDENGNFMGKVQQDGAHYGMMMHGGKSISFSFADPVHDPQAIDNGHIDKLHFVSNAEVMQILTESGVFNPKNQENKYSFTKNESNASNIKGEGRMDYVVTGIFRGTSIVNYSNYLFVTNNQGEYSAHNTYNFGNYLWGAGVSALGIPYLMAWLGSNINNFLFDTLSKWHMDSKDDQYSIKQGFIWQQNRK